ncbi:MAG: hypothetical protein AAGF12_15680 [Myxococcota bacterium]
MAQKKSTSSAKTRRGSPEAIAKRRAARQLNTILSDGSGDRGLDGRTEKRRRRLVKELQDGRRGKALKPIDFITHVNELLELGETLASLKKEGVKPRKTELSPDVETAIRQTQEAYAFHPEAWRMLGVRIEEIVGGGKSRRGKARK